MVYRTEKIKGKGRGKLLGYPTINLEIPSNFNEEEGIYAGWVWIGIKKYKGAFHFGPVPTFHEKEKSLEVFLIGADERDLKNIDAVEIELVKKTRDVVNFSSQENLIKQIGIDIGEIQRILS